MNRTNVENQYVRILSLGVHLEGILSIPEDAKGIVVFVHGSGSSRHSPRNQYVAQTIQAGGLATLLFDLLTADEEEIDLQTRHLRFDIDLLARRTSGVLEWVALQPYECVSRVGLFGSSTGAAAALIAAAELPHKVHAVVSRGGRPDLAGEALPKVQAPTLLMVGAKADQHHILFAELFTRKLTDVEHASTRHVGIARITNVGIMCPDNGLCVRTVEIYKAVERFHHMQITYIP